jgi:Tfp pilus assembly protein PilO
MKRYFDNLRPFEKRVLVVVATALFVVLNLAFVMPYFSQWGRVQTRMSAARRKLALYSGEAAQIPAYQKQIRTLAGDNQDVPAEDQANQFSRAIQMQQTDSGVLITSTSKQSSRTNEFFLELSQNIGVQSSEKQLVNFLYNLGSGGSLIRVRDMNLHTDPSHQSLVANIKLVASYQKAATKAPAKTAPPATTANAKRP